MTEDYDAALDGAPCDGAPCDDENAALEALSRDELDDSPCDGEVTITDIGPIEELRLHAPPGVITVLTGPNGIGKTQALNAAAALASGKGRLERRDGTTGGRAEGFGVTIKVGRGGNRRTGELEIEAVEDRLDIAALVEPGVKDLVAADARRIKALVSLAGVEAKPELFYDLAGGKEAFWDVVKNAVGDAGGDLVAMAAAAKRDFEAESRRESNIAENLGSEIRAAHLANEDIDLEAPHDADELQAAFEQAVTTSAAEKQRSADAQEKLDVARMARERLEASKAEYDGLTVEIAGSLLDICCDKCAEQQKALDGLQLLLRAATHDIEESSHHEMVARERLARAEDHEKSIARWETHVAAAENVDPPNSVVISALDAAVGDSRGAMETGVRVRDARERAAAAALLGVQRKQADANSKRFRDAAHGTEDVLSRIVAGMGGVFKVDREFRLVVESVRGSTYFAELSHGERWKLGLDVAIEAFNGEQRRGLLAIPQDAWEGLDFDNRRLIAKHIVGTDLAVITAEASRDEHADAAVGVTTFE